jgi:MerR family transcriptional regulator/heat shock protein HspR
LDDQDAVFIISVAARLVEMHPSTLRKYERCGLLEPGRLSGRLRLYSPDDIARLRQIKNLVDDKGINLAGVELALRLTDYVRALQCVADEDLDPERLRAGVRHVAERMLALLGDDADRSKSPNARSTQPASSEPLARSTD